MQREREQHPHPVRAGKRTTIISPKVQDQGGHTCVELKRDCVAAAPPSCHRWQRMLINERNKDRVRLLWQEQQPNASYIL